MRDFYDPSESAFYRALLGEDAETPEDQARTDFGSRDSGGTIVRPNGQPFDLGRFGLPQIAKRDGLTLPTMPGGTAQVHVSAVIQPPDVITPAVPAVTDWRQRLVLDVGWQNGDAGGSAQVDATQGCTFTVGGIHGLSIVARLVDPDTGGIPAVPGPAVKVEAIILWKVSQNPKEVYMALPRIAIAGGGIGVESVKFAIPSQAKSFMLLTTVPASAAGMIARFYWNAAAVGSTLAYRTDNPLANGTPIVGGVNFFTVETGVAMTVMPVFGLCL